MKLADFGLARIKSFPTKTYSHEVVTLWYRPPDVLLGSTEYSTPIDIWAVGCIFYEMACGRPLFAGTKVDEELYLIFKCLGTPTEETLPGVTSNTEFQGLRLPHYNGESLNHLAPRLDPNGIDLLEQFLRFNPVSRISAHDAMMHRFFSCYPPAIHSLGPLQSVLDINEITLTKDHGSKLITASLMKTAISKRSSVHLWCLLLFSSCTLSTLITNSSICTFILFDPISDSSTSPSSFFFQVVQTLTSLCAN